MLTLFIGGPADGKIIDIPEDRDWWRVSDEPPAERFDAAPDYSATYSVFDYRREYLVGKDGSKYQVMAILNLGECLVAKLLNGYRKGVKP